MKSKRNIAAALLVLAFLLSSSFAIVKHNRNDGFVYISLLWFLACLLVVLKSPSPLRLWALSVGTVIFAFGIAEAYLVGWLPGQHRVYIVEPLGVIHELHPILGYAGKKNTRVIVRKYYGRELLFDVQYTTDQNGLRVSALASKRPHPKASAPSVLFLGDSFTFGWGVNDHEAMPYRFEEKSKGRFKSFNFGFNGYGPHQMLAILENGLERKVVKNHPPRFAVYQALPQHIDRCAGHAIWDPRGPRYVLDAQYQPHYTGPFYSVCLRDFMTLMGRSQVLTHLVTAMRKRTPRDVDLYVSIVKRSEILFKERYGGQFYVLLWDRDDPSYAEILSKMREHKIAVIEIKNVLPDYHSEKEKYRIPHDGHPNKLAHEKIAEYFVKFLREKTTDLPR